MLVYTPLIYGGNDFFMKGEDMSLLLSLPSGITISWDGQSNIPKGKFRQVGKLGHFLIC